MKTYTNKELAAYIDHAVLDPAMTVKQLKDNIMVGVHLGCKTVCVNPDAIEIAKDCIQGSETLLCVVLDFPFGSSQSLTKVQQCRDIIHAGGIFEIDMVANYGRIKSRDFDYVSEEIRQVSEICHQNHVGLKVIVETDALTQEEAGEALECCVKGRADFIKTSTGYFKGDHNVGATPEIIQYLVEKADGRIKVKGSGCVRSRERLIELIELGIDRAGVGCGSTQKIFTD